VSDARQLDLPAFLDAAREFGAKLSALKREHPLGDHDWYPYDSMTAVGILERLLARDFHLLPPLLAGEPVLDVGCADGDLAFLFESLGAEVDAIDYSEMNFNQLAGARRMRELLGSRAGVYSVNLDWYFDLPRNRYGLILFLGTLYHLKNPLYVLETLARRGAYCLLSTRVARSTGPGGVSIEHQPVAYLLDEREANDDPTNYWIFSEAGLLRLVSRAGWGVVSKLWTGCGAGSNPVDEAADERMFLLLKSRVRYPELHVRLLDGWHPVEADRSRWTAREFAIEVEFPRGRRARELALEFAVPESVLAAGSPVTIVCEVDGAPAGTATCDRAGQHTLRGVLPDTDAARVVIRFRVEHDFKPGGGDTRSLGVRISFADELAGGGSGLPVRFS